MPSLNPMVGKELGTGQPQERAGGGGTGSWEGPHRVSPQLFCLAGGTVGGMVSSWLCCVAWGPWGAGQAEGKIGRVPHLLSQSQSPHTLHYVLVRVPCRVSAVLTVTPKTPKTRVTRVSSQV